MKSPPSRSLVWLAYLLIAPTFGQEMPEAIHFEVHSNKLFIWRQDGSFVAPHLTKRGDTFASLSEEFYGNPKEGDILARVAGLPVDAVLKPGTSVYMIESSFTVPFDAQARASQLDQALECAERMGDQLLSAGWDITLPIFNTAGELPQPTASQLELRLATGKSVALTITFPAQAVMIEILKGKVAAADVRCHTTAQ